MTGLRRGIHNDRTKERGQAILEVALTFPLLIAIAIGLVQFAIYYHAQNVVIGAVQDGARLAASEDGTIGEGVARTQALLRAGLGVTAGEFAVGGTESRDVVAVEARGGLRTIIPWVGGGTVPLGARTVATKERFRVGPGG